MRDKIIVIVGPTAVGKTTFSIELAKRFNGEIINGDSMQIYKELNIGTAKVTTQEMENIPHHLIDIKEIDESYSVAEFQNDASQKIKEIKERNRLPIIVGGTGLYMESLLYPVTHSGDAEPNMALRKELEQYAHENGADALWEQLNKIDSEAAQSIHPNNIRRVIRAIEVFYETGKKFSTLQNERKTKESKYDAHIICLNTDREVLYQRINTRVDQMLKEGLVDEVKALWKAVGPDINYQSTKGIGYKELFSYFNNENSFEESIELIKRNSRRYAKRQLTWFRNRLSNVHWYDFIKDSSQIEESFTKVEQFLEED